jgi:hypothetical protein
VYDVLHGEVTADVDDVVLVRNDGVPAYNLAAAGERVTLDAMLERFDPGRLPRRPWVVMAEKFTGAKRLRRDSP